MPINDPTFYKNEFLKPTGKNNKVILTKPTVFDNSENMFIEYLDIIKAPLLVPLIGCNYDTKINIFDLTPIKDLDLEALYEWYINRKEFNFYKLLKPNPLGPLKDLSKDKLNEFCDELLKSQLNMKEIIEADSRLNFASFIPHLKDPNLIHNIYFYTPFYSECIEKDLIFMYGKREHFHYVYGDFKEVILENDISNNSTFVFSDFSKIKDLEAMDKLENSSILVPNPYGYSRNNLTDEEFEKLIVNHNFSIDFFENAYETI